MGTMLILKNGRGEFIGRDRHFEDLLREHLGNDAADYFKNRVSDLLSTIEEAKECSNLEDVREVLEDVDYE